MRTCHARTYWSWLIINSDNYLERLCTSHFAIIASTGSVQTVLSQNGVSILKNPYPSTQEVYTLQNMQFSSPQLWNAITLITHVQSRLNPWHGKAAGIELIFIDETSESLSFGIYCQWKAKLIRVEISLFDGKQKSRIDWSHRSLQYSFENQCQ